MSLSDTSLRIRLRYREVGICPNQPLQQVINLVTLVKCQVSSKTWDLEPHIIPKKWS